MSKAEDRAKEAYPLRDAEHVYDEELVIEAREYFAEGYHQAEKDLELTWEDLAIIKQLSDDFVKHNQTPMSDEEFYKEIVKRFKERKEK